MGVRGLTTYINQYSDKYLEDHKLRNCKLVIDGSSLACILHVNSTKYNNAFGGDYDRLATVANDFFKALKKCHVTPLVIFDGGYEKSKFKTCISRIRKKWITARIVTPVSQHRSVFPVFFKETLKDVLRLLHIPFAQCLFEADVEIAAIARTLNCPVLSYDSDFFIYNVQYIPYPSLFLYPCKDLSAQTTDEMYYMSCRLYRVENILKQHKGLQKEAIPFLSILLGCDYVGNLVYKCFVCQIKRIKSRNSKHRTNKIASLLDWLQTETYESAKTKVINCLRKHRRNYYLSQIEKIMSIYVKGSSDLFSFLGIDVSSLQAECLDEGNNILQSLIEQQESISSEGEICNSDVEESDETDETSSCSTGGSREIEEVSIDNIYETENQVPQFENICEGENNLLTPEMKRAACLPVWFLNGFKQGDFPSMLMDMIIFNCYFLPPQVEDYSFPSSHLVSLPLITVIFGLLVGNEKKSLRCYIREHRSPNHFIFVKPTLKTTSVKFPLLDDLTSLALPVRLLIVKETAGWDYDKCPYFTSLPVGWQLYLLAVVFWAQQRREPVINSSHIDALLLCLVLLQVVRNNKLTDSRKNKKKLKKRNMKETKCEYSVVNNVGEKNLQCELDLDSQSLVNDTAGGEEELRPDVLQALKNVNPEECVLTKKILHPFCFTEEKLKTKAKLFNITTVHSFSQFQSCLLHLMYLNALLRHPLPQCVVSQVFSGTFVYNMYTNLKKRTSALNYVSHLLCNVPSVLTLFKALREMINNLIPEIASTDSTKRKTRKKKRCNKNRDSEEPTNDIESVDTDFEDPCNRFAVLALND